MPFCSALKNKSRVHPKMSHLRCWANLHGHFLLQLWSLWPASVAKNKCPATHLVRVPRFLVSLKMYPCGPQVLRISNKQIKQFLIWKTDSHRTQSKLASVFHLIKLIMQIGKLNPTLMILQISPPTRNWVIKPSTSKYSHPDQWLATVCTIQSDRSYDAFLGKNPWRNQVNSPTWRFHHDFIFFWGGSHSSPNTTGTPPQRTGSV